MSKLLTVSIAAYNIEKYIQQTLNCFVNTKYLNEKLLMELEVLIVNDGSTDQTAKVAQRYEEEYPQLIRVINKENGGHGSTINVGIQEAKGKYFKALDGDDWFDEQGIAHVMECLEKTEADIIITDYIKYYEDGCKCLEHVDGVEKLEEFKEYDFDGIIDNISWIPYHAAIYKTNVLQEHHIRLDENCFYVDTELMLYPIPYIQSIMYIKCNLYCYRLGLNGQSVSIESRKKNISNGEKVAISLLDMYQNQEKELSLSKKKYIIKGIGGHCIWHYRSLLLFRPNTDIKSNLIQFDRRIMEISKEIYSCMSNKSKLVYWMRKSHYCLYWLICYYRQYKAEK